MDYIRQILNSDNWLAIVIVLDIISLRKSETSIKKLINRFRNRIITEYFSNENPQDGMYNDIWLLAYEADKNKWLNTSGTDTFLFARKHPFFKELRNFGVDFYDCDFTYETVIKPESKTNIYVTRKELIELLKEYKDSVDATHGGNAANGSPNEIKESIYQKIVNALANAEDY